MSLDKLKAAFGGLNSCQAWSIQLLRITTSKKIGTRYASREISLSPPGKLLELISELSDRYAKGDKCQLNTFSSVSNYDGSAVGTTIYKLSIDNQLIQDEYKALIEAVAAPDTEADPFAFSPQAYLMQGVITVDGDEVGIKLFSMQKPITILKHKYMMDQGTFKEISDKVLSLRPTIDIVILGNTVYLLTLAGEALFNMERAYKAICADKVVEIEDSGIISDCDAFKDIASTGHNPRKFIAFNESRLNYLKDKYRRVMIASKFSIPLNDDKFDTSIAGASEKIVKLLCNKGMLDPFEDSPVEVAGAKKWQ
jgi:hypothetical protein